MFSKWENVFDALNHDVLCTRLNCFQPKRLPGWVWGFLWKQRLACSVHFQLRSVNCVFFTHYQDCPLLLQKSRGWTILFGLTQGSPRSDMKQSLDNRPAALTPGTVILSGLQLKRGSAQCLVRSPMETSDAAGIGPLLCCQW